MKWRWLALLVLLPALAWSGWWVVGSRLKTAALEAWLAERRAAGWVAEAAGIETAGFPSRFDTRVSALRLANPQAGWLWETPFLDILMMSWQPNAAIAALPSGQTVGVPGGSARLDAALLRASIRFVPGPSLALAQLSAEAGDLALVGDAGWRAAARKLAAHLRALPPDTGPPDSYAAWIEAEAVLLPPELRALIDPADALAAVADSLVIDARLAFDGPLDRRAVEDRPPALERLGLQRAELRWGTLSLAANGSLAADAQGLAAGELTVRAENWRQMLDALTRSGAIGRDTAGALGFALGLVARERGGRSVIEVPLAFGDGIMRLGPIPVGRAPRLRPPR